MDSTDPPESLEFEHVYDAELEEIRARRRHRWRAQQPKLTISNTADGSAEDDERIIEGIPAPTPAKRADAQKALALEKMLKDLESARKAFIEELRCADEATPEATPKTTKNKSAEDKKAKDNKARDNEAGADTDPSRARHYGLTGLALSGGGVRSATFCLGAVQALAKWDVFAKFDYLSTVSGGGFIGSSISSLYADGSTAFPFAHKLGVPEGEPLRHLRNFSNYLVPRGLIDYLKAPGLLLRGVLINFTVILPYVLIAAIVTVYLAGTRIREAALKYNTIDEIWGGPGADLIWSESFEWTFRVLKIGLGIMLLFPVAQKMGAKYGWSSWNLRDLSNQSLAAMVVITIAIAILEAQPIAVFYSVRISEFLNRTDFWNLDIVVGAITAVAGVAAAVSGKIAPKVNRLAGKIVLVVIGLLGPIVLWLIYLTLTRWAICGPPSLLGGWIAELIHVNPKETERLCFNLLPSLSPTDFTGKVSVIFAVATISIFFFGFLFFNANRNSLHTFYRDRLSRAYLFKRSDIDINRNSGTSANTKPVVHNDKQPLHELRCNVPVRRQNTPLDFFRLLPKAPMFTYESRRFVAPYHLINATVNVRIPNPHLIEEGDTRRNGAGQHADIHGRRADFFLFSPLFIGSKITSYCHTEYMRYFDRHVDLGTAMAISGAAAAPNMGTSTVRPLVFVLTLLNIRLGYWLPNPGSVYQKFYPSTDANSESRSINLEDSGRVAGAPRWRDQIEDRVKNLWRKFRRRVTKIRMKVLHEVGLSVRVGPLYLLLEMFGRLKHSWPFINVSDGGHIENLGLYPLLLRKCRLIVAIDGERDPPKGKKYKFSALANAIRYAKIDHGIDVHIVLDNVGKKGGNHFAVGRINYGKGHPDGWLVYVKSSLTGDENPYINEYKLRKPDFPHETTGDQFFDETQFECYRALGYHAVEDFLERSGSKISSDWGLQQLFPIHQSKSPDPDKGKRSKSAKNSTVPELT